MTIVKQVEQLNIELKDKGFKILNEEWDGDVLVYKKWCINNSGLNITLTCSLKNRTWYYYLIKNNNNIRKNRIKILEIKFNEKQSINKILNTIDKIKSIEDKIKSIEDEIKKLEFMGLE